MSFRPLLRRQHRSKEAGTKPTRLRNKAQVSAALEDEANRDAALFCSCCGTNTAVRAQYELLEEILLLKDVKQRIGDEDVVFEAVLLFKVSEWLDGNEEVALETIRLL